MVVYISRQFTGRCGDLEEQVAEDIPDGPNNQTFLQFAE